LVTTAFAVVARRRARDRRRCAREADVEPVPGATIPKDYRAAGVIFFVRGLDGDVAHVLLGLEERKVSLKEHHAGKGTGWRRLLLFPQGKREPTDRNFVDTAMREFVEETADAAGLSQLLEPAASGEKEPPPSAWFQQAKMAVTFCEVGVAGSTPPLLATAEDEGQAEAPPLTLRPVWVHAGELRRVLAAASGRTEVHTDFWWFSLFPMTRRFLRTVGVTRWLGRAAGPAT